MIEDNIKRLRKNAHMSQEDLAVHLAVTRQTISKWENGLSVPDAEMVIKIAELFHTSVNEILGVNVNHSVENLAEELAKANEIIAEKNRLVRNMQLVEKKRGFIIFMCFLALFFALLIKNHIVSICLIGLCFLIALAVLYRNLALLTSVSTNEIKIRALKITTIFNVSLLLICILAAVLTGLGILKLSEDNEKILAMIFVSIIMIFTGMISPKLPFNRHTGLRLPWTVYDEETWNVAHKIIGFISLPIAVLYILGAMTLDHFETVTLVAILAWIGVPAIISLIYYFRKSLGKI